MTDGLRGTIGAGRIEDARLARQFVFGPSAEVPAALSALHPWGDALLACHPSLDVTRAGTPARDLLCLGHLLDADAPDADNATVVDELFRRCSTFEQFEAASARLGGRWIALLRIGAQTRLYLDAAGMRSVFVGRLPDGTTVAASQPALLEQRYGLHRDAALDRSFREQKHFANSWPCELTPYPQVRQLLPNHYLDLNRGTTHRHWPQAAPTPVAVDDAARSIAARLRGFIAATRRRGPTALAMTAGYDSRTLFAAAGGLRKQLTLFRVNGRHLPWYDTQIPRQLVRRFGGKLVELAPMAVPADRKAVMNDNVAFLWSDPGAYMLHSFAALGVRFVLLGQLAEITRCFYYADGVHPGQLDASGLARAAHFDGHRLATDAFDRWLSGVPAPSRVPLLDLFYWEHRAGNWASMLATACDMYFEPIAPYNCRALLELALGVDVQHRRAPYELHRRICDAAEPGTAALPFNFSWRDVLRDGVTSRLPWRIRNWLERSDPGQGGA